MNAPKQQHQKILNDFINRLTTLKQQIGSFIITPSRRTPQNMLQTMLNAIQDVLTGAGWVKATTHGNHLSTC